MSYPTPQFANVTITSGGAIVGSNVLTIAGVTNLQTTLNGLLPLTGGTLTGALNGTTATFSGAINASNFSGSSSGTNTGDQAIPVTSVFGRTGAIDAESGDYGAFYLGLGGGTLTGGLNIENGATAPSASYCWMAMSNGENYLGAYPLVTVTSGAFNPIVEPNDALLAYSMNGSGTPTNGFVIAPWSGVAGGMRFDASGNVTAAAEFTVDGTLNAGNVTVNSGNAASYTLTVGIAANTYAQFEFPEQSGANYPNAIKWYRNNSNGIALGVWTLSESLFSVTDSGALNIVGAGTGTNWVATSDRRIKANIRPLDDAKALAVTSVESKQYHNLRSDRDEVGLLAQDVLLVDPTMVLDAPDGMLSLDYDRLAVHHQRVIQMLMKQVATLEAKVAELEERL